jgi:hypothetical protein
VKKLLRATKNEVLKMKFVVLKIFEEPGEVI